MATRGVAATRIVLTRDERAELERWARRPTSAAGLALRAKIVLAAAEGGSNTELASRLGVNRGTVTKWSNHFAEMRCDGLLDEPRPGRPRVYGDERIEMLITTTLETTPSEVTHWSTRSMAKHLGLSQSTVSRVWRAFGLAPHKQDSWNKPRVDRTGSDHQRMPRVDAKAEIALRAVNCEQPCLQSRA